MLFKIIRYHSIDNVITGRNYVSQSTHCCIYNKLCNSLKKRKNSKISQYKKVNFEGKRFDYNIKIAKSIHLNFKFLFEH